ncbi:MAG: formate dehydrogenase accessory sulfurtransferase FdhD [Candidatus Bathyarchaeia archaeon]
MGKTSARVKILSVDVEEGVKSSKEEEIAVEEPFFVHINGKHFVTLLSSPDMRREFAVGHLLGEGIIKSLSELKGIRLDGSNAFVSLSKSTGTALRASKTAKLVTTACGSTDPDFLKLLDRIKKPFVESRTSVSAQTILYAARRLSQESKIHGVTYGTHAAAIFTSEGQLVSFAEDVGRHNAVDKVIGGATLKGAIFARCLLVSSGRQPADMVLKAARVGIPIVASIAHPIDSGVRAAEKTGVTLVRIRGRQLTVYTNPQRIE